MKLPVWDIFCQVIDNWGDAGVCWRLAKQLDQQGIHVRLWIDDPSPLTWMNTSDTQVEIIRWKNPIAQLVPGQVLVEAFGCHAPESFLMQASKQPLPPVWINLEYLSAQKYAENSHGLPSPQYAGPARGLTRWFYYPGFTSKTGGLLREPDLHKQQQSFNPVLWFKQNHIPVIPHAQCISLFCYDNHALPALLEQWQQNTSPVHLLVTPGATAEAVNRILRVPFSTACKSPPCTHTYNQLTITWMPYLTQQDFDHLLWSCDINFVRGEDSWVRAIWAGKPFIWQPYIQDDGEHLHKLEAFLALVPQAPLSWLMFERQWVSQNAPDWPSLQNSLPDASYALNRLKLALEEQPDLVTQLLKFAAVKTL